MYLIEVVKRGVVEHFRSQAEWRARKAEEYPEDERNEVSAAALERLALHVEGLPEVDPLLQKLAGLDGIAPDLCYFQDDGTFLAPGSDGGSVAEYALSRFRFDLDPHDEEDEHHFFAYWVEQTLLVAAEDEEKAREKGDPHEAGT